MKPQIEILAKAKVDSLNGAAEIPLVVASYVAAFHGSKPIRLTKEETCLKKILIDLEISDEDKIFSNPSKRVWSKNGVTLVQEDRLSFTFKGEFFLKRRAFNIISNIFRLLHQNNIPCYLNDTHIQQAFFSKKGVGAPLIDLKKGNFNFKRPSLNAIFQPDLLVPPSKISTSSYYKSEHFWVVCYCLKTKFLDFQKQLARIKSNPRKKLRLEKYIWNHRNLWGSDRSVYRNEIRILGKQNNIDFLPLLLTGSEDFFCRSVLAKFHKSHALINVETKEESFFNKMFLLGDLPIGKENDHLDS